MEYITKLELIAHGWKPMTRLEKVGSFTETLEGTQITDR